MSEIGNTDFIKLFFLIPVKGKDITLSDVCSVCKLSSDRLSQWLSTLLGSSICALGLECNA